MELPEEAVGQLGSLVEEVLLQWGEGLMTQWPQEPFLTEERVVAEKAGQNSVLGHHVSVARQFFTKIWLCLKALWIAVSLILSSFDPVKRESLKSFFLLMFCQVVWDITLGSSPLYTPAVLFRPSHHAIYTPWAHCCLLVMSGMLRNSSKG